jgi:hypothetical protein
MQGHTGKVPQMGEVFKAVPAAMAAHSAVHHSAGDTVASAASVDHEAMLAAAAAALGPIGATYLAAYAPAQAHCIHSALQVSHVYHKIGDAIDGSTAAIVAADNA